MTGHAHTKHLTVILIATAFNLWAFSPFILILFHFFIRVFLYSAIVGGVFYKYRLDPVGWWCWVYPIMLFPKHGKFSGIFQPLLLSFCDYDDTYVRSFAVVQQILEALFIFHFQSIFPCQIWYFLSFHLKFTNSFFIYSTSEFIYY